MSAKVSTPAEIEVQPVQTATVDEWKVTNINITSQDIPVSVDHSSGTPEVIPAHTKDTISFSWSRKLGGVKVSDGRGTMTDEQAIELMTNNPEARNLLKAMGYDALKIMGEIPATATVE